MLTSLLANFLADFSSRNPVECPEKSCQVCIFIQDTEDSVVWGISVQDVTDGHTLMPFTNCAAWLATQRECPDLRHTHSYLTHRTCPTRMMTKTPDTGHYIRTVSKASDGLLVIRDDQPFHPSPEHLVVPWTVLGDLHICFSHPSRYQLRPLLNRYFMH